MGRKILCSVRDRKSISAMIGVTPQGGNHSLHRFAAVEFGVDSGMGQDRIISPRPLRCRMSAGSPMRRLLQDARMSASTVSAMLRCARMSGLRTTSKNVTISNRVLPTVCGTRFFNDFGKTTRSDKNGRFDRADLGTEYFQQFLTTLGFRPNPKIDLEQSQETFSDKYDPNFPLRFLA